MDANIQCGACGEETFTKNVGDKVGVWSILTGVRCPACGSGVQQKVLTIYS